MTASATVEEIKAYEKKYGKKEIKPDVLPSCPVCGCVSETFKTHAHRERRFLVIINSMVKSILTFLVRYRCPGCGKTFTYYPDFAIPHKHYTRRTIVKFSRAYVENDKKTYLAATITNDGAPGYQEDGKVMAPSTIHRWVTTLGSYIETPGKALDLILRKNPATDICRNLASTAIPCGKYRSSVRKNCLIACRRFLKIEALFLQTFEISIFTKLAIRGGFS